MLSAVDKRGDPGSISNAGPFGPPQSKPQDLKLPINFKTNRPVRSNVDKAHTIVEKKS